MSDSHIKYVVLFNMHLLLTAKIILIDENLAISDQITIFVDIIKSYYIYI